ncbi:MAG: hypothetical protein ACFE95_02755 [Candidatus Hodarchaeota archaeon]
MDPNVSSDVHGVESESTFDDLRTIVTIAKSRLAAKPSPRLSAFVEDLESLLDLIDQG